MLWWVSLAAALTPSHPDYVAPELAADTFRPSVDAQGTWSVQDAERPAAYTARAQLWYLRSPLVWESQTGERSALVEDVAALGLGMSWGRGPFSVGASLPLYLASDGYDGAHGAAVGDPALDVRWVALTRPLGAAALSGRVTAPMGAADQQLGAPGFTWQLTAVGQLNPGPIGLIGNVGFRGQPRVELASGVALDDQGVAAGAVTWSANSSLTLSAEATAWITWSALGQGGVPAEGLVSAHWTTPKGAQVRAGVGTGLTRAPGSPRLRLVVGVGQQGPATP
jgi:hypothetical protein